jgi:hypothetical protein
MEWLFLLGVLVCAILFPKFRKVLIVLAILFAGFIAYFLISQDIEESASKKRIIPGEVELLDLRLVRSGSYYDLRGRVRNRSSKYSLSGFTLKVTLDDCVDANTCDVVYQEDHSPLVGLVPPGQARDFEVYGIGGVDMRLKGSLKWHYALTGVRGRE